MRARRAAPGLGLAGDTQQQRQGLTGGAGRAKEFSDRFGETAKRGERG